MASKVLRRLALAAVLVGGVALVAASSAEATRPVRRTTRPQVRGFNLFAGAVNVVMNVNRVQCNVNSIGETCVDPTNSPTLGGGFWPKGSPDQYIFNGGLQIAALMGGTGPWAGDTVGAFFFDARGDQAHGEGRTNVFNALSAGDLAAWPTAAYINDTSLFSSGLIGRKTASQQDTWVRYWDGNTNLVTGRQHPMGLLVEQRGLAWNFPTGNQDIIYFLYRFINITSRNAADYANLADWGYSAADIAEIVAIAQEFQDRAEAVFNVALPDAGIPFTNMYAAFGQDADVGNAGSNYSNGNFPFAMGMAYKANFSEPQWQYPPDIFGAPFAAAPGFEGVKYLRSPVDTVTGREFGMSMWTNTTNGGEFPDRVGVQALWRLYSGNLIPSDGICTPGIDPLTRHFCRAVQSAADTRFYMGSGPLTLNPGQSAVIVVAYVHAAPVASMACQNTGACPGGSWSLTPFINGNMLPGFPVDGARLLVAGQDTLRNLDRAAGWIGHSDADADGIIEQTEVRVVPRSLYGKALVAQAVFDSKFLLPFAPEVPNFFLVPGDNQVTIVWSPSSTETDGDPFFAIASQPLIGGVANALYDPNFREFDVEGYRIWRGRTQAEMQVVASFDYAGTTIRDYTGAFVTASTGNRCAPEIGVTASCPVAYDWPGTIPPTRYNAVELAGDVIQIPPGGRVQLADGTIFNVAPDTAVIGGGSGLPGLTDGGVPFSFTDTHVRNGFRYYYAVTAFDINSVASGPSSLESPLVTKTVTPRATSGQEAGGSVSPVEIVLGDGSVGNPSAAEPTVDATTGIFSGPQPPTNAIDAGMATFLPNLLGSGNVTITIDSVIPGSGLTNIRPTMYYMTAQSGSVSTPFTLPFQQDSPDGNSYWDDVTSYSTTFPAAPVGQAQGARFGGDSTYLLHGQITLSAPGTWGLTMKGRGYANGHPDAPFNGPRWWEGAANENTNDPNGLNCIAQTGSFACTLANLSRHAGAIAGVDIFAPMSYFTVGSSAPQRDFEGITSTVFRAADFKVYWGAAGVVDSVVDVTHRVRVPFSPKLRASWGIMNDSSFTNVPAGVTRDTRNAVLTWTDPWYVAPVPAILRGTITGGVAVAASPDSGAFLMDHAKLTPIAFASSTAAGTAALAANGNGFIFYLNGHFFLMRMAALPAAGTVWNARFYAGHVTGTSGSYAFTNGVVRPAAVPGLRARFTFSGSTFDPSVTTAAQLESVHTVPDPYYVTNSLEITANTKVLRFVNLPAQALIRIYSVSGILVNIINHNDVGGGGEATWNLRNRNNQFVASGVYFYHVETPDGREKIGRFTVVNYAQ